MAWEKAFKCENGKFFSDLGKYVHANNWDYFVPVVSIARCNPLLLKRNGSRQERSKETNNGEKEEDSSKQHSMHHILLLLSSAIQTPCNPIFSFENIHFPEYLRFRPRRTAFHDPPWVLHYLTIIYQLHNLLSVEDEYLPDLFWGPPSLLFNGYRGLFPQRRREGFAGVWS
jgi:hypothetical protein